MYITLYFIVNRLPDSLRSVRDHFLSLDPTSLTVDQVEQHLLAAETSVVAVGSARGTSRTPFFEGCSPSPLAPSYASAVAVDVLSTEDVGAASTSAKRRSSKGKGGRSGGGGSSSGGGGSSGGSGGSGGGGSGGSGGGSGGVGGGKGGSGGSGCIGSGGNGSGRTGAQRGGSGGGQRQQKQRRKYTPLPQQLREWLFQRGASGGSVSCTYVIRTGDCAGQTCGKAHTQHCYFSCLDDAWRADFGDEVERPHWAELLSAEGVSYRCVPPDPGIEAAARGASESVLPGSAPAEALHTFTLDSGASRCFFRDSTTLTPLPAPVPVQLANPSGGPVVARSSTILPCLAIPSGSLSGLHLLSFSTNLVSTAALQDAMVTTTTPGGQCVSICTCTWTDRNLATFTHRPGSSPYTLATEPPQVAASAQVSASGSVAPPCSCLLATCKLHDTMRTTLAALRFAPSTADPSLFLCTDTSLPPFYALVYVGDLVFATADTEALTLVKSELLKRHTCTDLGEVRSYLVLKITRDKARRTITLTQSHMVHQVLQRFCFQLSSPHPTPLSTGHSLSAPPSDESVEPSGPYPELVGCLMYLMTCTRPDLAYPLSLLAPSHP
ncbi:unnamed protein product [Closterium sp. NIES-54]